MTNLQEFINALHSQYILYPFLSRDSSKTNSSKFTREVLRYSKKNVGLKFTATFYTNPFWHKESLKVRKWSCKKIKSMKMVIKKKESKKKTNWKTDLANFWLAPIDIVHESPSYKICTIYVTSCWLITLIDVQLRLDLVNWFRYVFVSKQQDKTKTSVALLLDKKSSQFE